MKELQATIGRVWPRDGLYRMATDNISDLAGDAPMWVIAAAEPYGGVEAMMKRQQQQWLQAIEEYDRRMATGENVALYDTPDQPFVMRVASLMSPGSAVPIVAGDPHVRH